MKLKIRAAKRKDAKAIVMLTSLLAKHEGKKSLFEEKEYLKEGFGKKKSFSTIVATLTNEIVGYVSFHSGYDLESASKGLYIIDLFVASEFRGKRVGSRLLNAVKEESRSLNGKWVAWNVSPGNTAAIGFYEGVKANRGDTLQFWIKTEKSR